MRRAILPASYLAFLAGMLASAAIFYRNRPFDPRSAILSHLQSRDHNPGGYFAAAAGIALSAMLLAPATAVFYRYLRHKNSTLALAGAVTLIAGVIFAIGIGVLAPFTHGNSTLHLYLASATFLCICCGSWIQLLAARVPQALLLGELIATLGVVLLCCGWVNFDDGQLLKSTALWEWVLCVQCATSLWVLARHIELPRESQTVSDCGASDRFEAVEQQRTA